MPAEHDHIPLSDRLRDTVAAEALADATGYWPIADYHFAAALAAGADPAAIVSALADRRSGSEAAAIITNPNQPWNCGRRPASFLAPTNQDLEMIANAARTRARHALTDTNPETARAAL